MSKKFITIEEYAELLGVSQSTVRRMCNRGDLNCIKVGRQWRISTDSAPDDYDLKINSIYDCFKAMSDAISELQEKLKQPIEVSR